MVFDMEERGVSGGVVEEINVGISWGNVGCAREEW